MNCTLGNLMHDEKCGDCQLFQACLWELERLKAKINPVARWFWTKDGQEWMFFDNTLGFFPVVRKATRVSQVRCLNFHPVTPQFYCGGCKFYPHICRFKWNVRAGDKPCIAQEKLGSNTYLKYTSDAQVRNPKAKLGEVYKPAYNFHPKG